MACMTCLDRCVPIEEETNNFREEFLIDLEKVILKVAHEQVKLVPPSQLTWRERMCPLDSVVKLEVDKSFLGVQPSSEMTLIPRVAPKGGDMDVPTKLESGTSVLFSSRYTNNTDHTQVYSFKTERQTKSSLELSLQRGFTLGSSLEMDVKIPTGVDSCEVSGKLGTQLTWSFQRGKITRQEDTVTWSVDSQVAVGRGKIGEARLSVKEARWTADFVMPCRITPRTQDLKIPVFVRRKKTGDLLQVVGVNCADVVEECDDYFRLSDQNDAQILCELRGVCHVVCAVEQEVWLREAEVWNPHPQLVGPGDRDRIARPKDPGS